VLVESRRWTLAAAVFLLVLAACTSTGGRPGLGTAWLAPRPVRFGGTGRPEGGPARVGHRTGEPGVRAELRHPVGRSVPGPDAAADGALLENYYAIGHSGAANYVAQVSGQGPGSGHQEGLPGVLPPRRPHRGRAVPPGSRRGLRLPGGSPDARQPAVNRRAQPGSVPAEHGQRPGPGQHGQHGARAGPRHPATGAIDHTQKAAKGDRYAARHDGFTFFRSVTGNPAYCDAHILTFRPLPGDLTRASTTPAFSWILPNLCDDGHDAPCVTGAPGGLAQAGAFLSQWVPKIMAASAYQDGGLFWRGRGTPPGANYRRGDDGGPTLAAQFPGVDDG
jgi:phosphatidylinositol-3-phosphatase